MHSITTAYTLSDWKRAYEELHPAELLPSLLHSLSNEDVAWLSLATTDQLDSQLAELEARLDKAGGNRDALPLYGVPFAIKDNIDAAGWTTTAACPEFAYVAEN
ncbi:amidase family protein, partial [Pseudomonas aeruginosa]